MVNENKNKCCDLPGVGTGCHVEAVVSVDERGQMVLPKEVREKAKIGAGDKLALITFEREGKICCLSLIKVEELAAMVKDILGPVIQEISGGRSKK